MIIHRFRKLVNNFCQVVCCDTCGDGGHRNRLRDRIRNHTCSSSTLRTRSISKRRALSAVWLTACVWWNQVISSNKPNFHFVIPLLYLLLRRVDVLQRFYFFFSLFDNFVLRVESVCKCVRDWPYFRSVLLVVLLKLTTTLKSVSYRCTFCSKSGSIRRT